MPSVLYRLPILAACLFTTACASTGRPAENLLDAGARQHIQTVEGVLFAKQDQIGADIQRNKLLSDISALTAGTTMIPMLVDMGVTGVKVIEANKLAKPMRDSLDGHDYAWEFRKHVKQSLAGKTLGDVESFRIVREESEGLRGQLIAESEADAVLLVDMRYGFTPSFENLYVHSTAMLFPNTPELVPFQEAPDRDRVLEFSDNIYRNQFVASLSTGLEDADKEAHAAYWAKLSKEDLKEVLEAAGLALADSMANDIELDDLDSDLDVLPDGYRLNTKYDNFNAQFAKTRGLDGDAQAAPDDTSDEEDITVSQTIN